MEEELKTLMITERRVSCEWIGFPLNSELSFECNWLNLKFIFLEASYCPEDGRRTATNDFIDVDAS